MAHFNEYLDLLELSPLVYHFLHNGKKQLYKKGEFFCRADEVCHHIAYVSKGGFRYFCLDKEGDKHITGYSFEKDFVTDYYSFTRQMPAIVCTEAVKDSTVYQLSHEQLENFWELNSQNQLLGRKIAENLFCMTYHRLLDFYSVSPKVCYQELLKRCPDIVQQTSLKEIASFLNISPYTLSRIRRKITFE